MTKSEMRETIQKIHSEIVNNVPIGCTDAEIMYIYQRIAHMLMTETTEWARQDFEKEQSVSKVKKIFENN